MSDPRNRDRALVVGALALLAVVSLAPGPAATAAATAAAVVLAVAALLRGGAAAKPTAVLAALLMLLVPTGLLWQPVMAVALGLLALGAWRRPDLRVSLGLGRVPWVATFATGAVTPLALVGWMAGM